MSQALRTAGTFLKIKVSLVFVGFLERPKCDQAWRSTTRPKPIGEKVILFVREETCIKEVSGNFI